MCTDTGLHYPDQVHLTGHTIVDEVTVTGNVRHIDTGAGVSNRRLTIARVDVHPIETLTMTLEPRKGIS